MSDNDLIKDNPAEKAQDEDGAVELEELL